jgi:hypothetical protein
MVENVQEKRLFSDADGVKFVGVIQSAGTQTLFAGVCVNAEMEDI